MAQHKRKTTKPERAALEYVELEDLEVETINSTSILSLLLTHYSFRK